MPASARATRAARASAAQAVAAPRKRASPSPVRLADDPQRVAALAEMGLMTESAVALLMGLSVKALRNRGSADKPASVKLSGARVYEKAAVERFIRSRRDA